MSHSRRLAALMFTDMVGFSRLTNQNPLLARELNEEHQKIVREFLKKYEGHERQTTGDGFFVEFFSATEAMQCAVEIQQALHDRNLTRSVENKIQIRIGLHVGDIFEKDHEIFGDTVNITARLEPLSEPEGICVSKNFYDLVNANWSATKFKSLGLFQLKNIKGDFELYKFNFGWEAPKKSHIKIIKEYLAVLLRSEQRSLVSLFGIGLFTLAFILGKAFIPQFQNSTVSSRNPASSELVQTKFLLGWLSSVNDQDWVSFNPKQSWKYADTLPSKYTLKNDFTISQAPVEPAIILGLIPDSHRVFLNGQYIGGAENLSDLAMYSFDPKLLRPSPEKNSLVVQINSRPQLNPGITLVDGIEPQLNEFNEVRVLHAKYYFKFYILKNIYFVFSFIAFILSLTYAIYLKNKNDIIYSSLFILLGCIHYAYYNPWVSSTFDYQFLRFLRLGCIILSSFVLISGYLASRQKKKFINWNNYLALIVSVFSFSLFNFYPFESTEKFVSAFNTFLLLGLVFTATIAFSSLFTEISQRKELRKKHSSIEPYFFLGFLFLSLTNFLGAFKNGTVDNFFSAQARTTLNDIGIATTFLFAVTRLGLALFEFTKQKRQNLKNKNKDNFFFELTKLISDSDEISNKIEKIQMLSHDFLAASRSTLYVVDPNDSDTLKMQFNRGSSEQLESTKSSLNGVFGYVLKNKRPLLIDDINEDYRFDLSSSNGRKNFKSGSCMLFPLISDDQVLGVLTFSDKQIGHTFVARDLEIGIKVCAFITLLLLAETREKKVS